MKKEERTMVTVLTIVLLTLITFSVSSAEETESFYLPDLDMNISVPSRMAVYTRDYCEDTRFLAQLGISYQSLVSYFKTSNIFLNAIDTVEDQEIVVEMTMVTAPDFKRSDDSYLNELSDAIVDQYSSISVTVLKHDLYRHAQTAFIRVFFYTGSDDCYGLQYYTILNGKAINITLRSYGVPIDRQKETLMKQTVDGVTFKTESTNTEKSSSAPFQYSDREAGVSFTVPAGWVWKELSKNRKYIDVKFVSESDGSSLIMYGSTDLWSQMSFSEQIGSSRKDIDSLLLPKQDIAQILGIGLSDVKEKTFHGVQYYQYTVTQDNVLGNGLSVAMTEMVHIRNGWMYTFQYSGTPDSALFSDFEKLLETVTYPQPSDTPIVTETGFFGETSADHSDTERDGWNVASLIGIFLVFLLPIIILVTSVIYVRAQRNHSGKDPGTVASSAAESKTDGISEAVPSINGTVLDGDTEKNALPLRDRYCRKCGWKLEENSKYCSRCGTKLTWEDDNR